jgi:hypothetical protein
MVFIMNDNFEEKYEPEFKNKQVFIQVGKILDSRGNKKEINEVITDDGKSVYIDFETAEKIIKVFQKAPLKFKRDLMTYIQMSDGLQEFISQLDIIIRYIITIEKTKKKLSIYI